MNIAICEDNMMEQKSLAACISNILEKWKIKAQIKPFTTGEELLTAKEKFSVYFLDIYLDSMTGVQAAKEIRRAAPEAMIIFTTSSPDYMAEGYDVGAIHYLLKPLTGDAVEKAMERVFRLTHAYEKYITLQCERIQYNVLLSSIFYVESKDKYCLITTKTGELRVYIKMSELEERLSDERFLRCHRSYLINMDYADSVEKRYFHMCDSTLIPVKRDHQLKMKQHFCEYCFSKLRREMK